MKQKRAYQYRCYPTPEQAHILARTFGCARYVYNQAFWACGLVVTHHRKGGRHYYDLPKRVIPTQYYAAEPLLDEAAFHRWIVLRRHQAAGLLRPIAETAIWSACGTKAERILAVQQLMEEGTLTPVHVGEKRWFCYMPTNLLNLLSK